MKSRQFKIWNGVVAMAFCYFGHLTSHCQMPCGIYHDDMVFDQVDEYVETMVKGDSVLNENQFNSIKDRNEFVRWVMMKEKLSDETALLITTYFLQQKIKPDEADTIKRLTSAHKLLFLIVQIKQTADVKIVKQFYDEWEKFKLMFHIEGYECKMEQIKLKERTEKENSSASDVDHTHSHDHNHDDDHTHTHEHDVNHDHK